MQAIYNGNSLKSGIYKIKNKVNEKVYIGSAAEFKTRYKKHLSSLTNGRHHNSHLQASFNKYGSDNFVFEVIEVIDDTTEVRREREQEYISEHYDSWEQCFNIQKFVAPANDNWTSSDERNSKIAETTKERWQDPEYREARMSKFQSEEYKELKRQQMKEWHSNPENKKKITEINQRIGNNKEARAKQSASLKENYKNNPERIEKMRQASKKTSAYSWRFINPQGNEVIITDLIQYCKDNNLSHGSMRNLVRQRYLTSRNKSGWVFVEKL